MQSPSSPAVLLPALGIEEDMDQPSTTHSALSPSYPPLSPSFSELTASTNTSGMPNDSPLESSIAMQQQQQHAHAQETSQATPILEPPTEQHSNDEESDEEDESGVDMNDLDDENEKILKLIYHQPNTNKRVAYQPVSDLQALAQASGDDSSMQPEAMQETIGRIENMLTKIQFTVFDSSSKNASASASLDATPRPTTAQASSNISDVDSGLASPRSETIIHANASHQVKKRRKKTKRSQKNSSLSMDGTAIPSSSVSSSVMLSPKKDSLSRLSESNPAADSIAAISRALRKPSRPIITANGSVVPGTGSSNNSIRRPILRRSSTGDASHIPGLHAGSSNMIWQSVIHEEKRSQSIPSNINESHGALTSALTSLDLLRDHAKYIKQHTTALLIATKAILNNNASSRTPPQSTPSTPTAAAASAAAAGDANSGVALPASDSALPGSSNNAAINECENALKECKMLERIHGMLNSSIEKLSAHMTLYSAISAQPSSASSSLSASAAAAASEVAPQPLSPPVLLSHSNPVSAASSPPLAPKSSILSRRRASVIETAKTAPNAAAAAASGSKTPVAPSKQLSIRIPNATQKATFAAIPTPSTAPYTHTSTIGEILSPKSAHVPGVTIIRTPNAPAMASPNRLVQRRGSVASAAAPINPNIPPTFASLYGNSVITPLLSSHDSSASVKVGAQDSHAILEAIRNVQAGLQALQQADPTPAIIRIGKQNISPPSSLKFPSINQSTSVVA